MRVPICLIASFDSPTRLNIAARNFVFPRAFRNLPGSYAACFKRPNGPGPRQVCLVACGDSADPDLTRFAILEEGLVPKSAAVVLGD